MNKIRVGLFGACREKNFRHERPQKSALVARPIFTLANTWIFKLQYLSQAHDSLPPSRLRQSRPMSNSWTLSIPDTKELTLPEPLPWIFFLAYT